MERSKFKQQKAITLVALVITIIVLLILAGITITQLTDSGLFNKTTEASQKSLKAETEDQLNLLLYEWQMENATKGKSIEEFFNEKLSDGHIEDIEVDDDNIEVFLNGYVAVIEKATGKIDEMQIAVARPAIVENSLNVTFPNGTEVTSRQEFGTVLKMSFLTSVEGGTITGISSPAGATIDTSTGEVTYTTTGNETEVVFEIQGIVGDVQTKAKRKISLKDYYEIIIEAESLIKAVEENSFSNDSIAKVIVEGETYSLHVYNYDEDLTISEDTEFGNAANDVATSGSVKAKNMVLVKVNGNLTIDQDVTVTACKNASGYGGPKGMMIYCTGTLTNNGTISMTQRGAYAEGQDVYLWKNSDNSFEYVPAVGATGNRIPNGRANTRGVDGNYGTLRKTGAGGSGGVGQRESTNDIYGGNGTSYSGGSGCGGSCFGPGSYQSDSNLATGGSNIGGAGGRGTSFGGDQFSGGGAGNPGGVGYYTNSVSNIGTNGTGGLLIIYANVLNNNSMIESKGSAGGNVGSANKGGAGGGGSGGGSINIFYKSSITAGNINANGGPGGAGAARGPGGAGGDGSVFVGKIENGNYIGNLILENDSTSYYIDTKVNITSLSKEVENYSYYLDGVKIAEDINNKYRYNDLIDDTNYTIKAVVNFTDGTYIESDNVVVKTKARTYLYNYGAENTGVAGSWILSNDQANGRSQKNADNILLYYVSNQGKTQSSAKTSNTINNLNYKYLMVKYKMANMMGSGEWTRLYLNGIALSATTNGEFFDVISTSSLGNSVINFYAYDVYAYIYQVWLE